MFSYGNVRNSLLVLALLAITAMTSCGGNSSAINPNPNPAINPGGAQGDLNNGGDDLSVDPSNVIAPHEIAGAWPDAPLGTDPAYAVKPAQGREIAYEPTKGSSTLGLGENYKINWVAVSLKGAEPDPQATGQVFEEGDSITLWANYEVRAATTYSRTWNIPSLNLDYLEPSINSLLGGVYTVGFDMTLGIGSATEDALFTFVVAEPKSASVIIIPETESKSVSFDVTPLAVLPPVIYPVTGEAQMSWEDLIVNSDYDYNDMVARMQATEWKDLSGNLVQVDLWVKAIARGAGYDAKWQFNIDAAFPGSSCVAIIDQYYASGLPHGSQRVWSSEDGASVPVFAPTRTALPNPPDHAFATNVVANTTFIDGDYAVVQLIFDPPVTAGTWTPIPYEPELKVYPNSGSVYTIGLWRTPGDEVDSNGRPLGFIIPDSFAWMLESQKIWLSYPGFNTWVSWINNNPNGPPPSPNWWDTNPVGTTHYRRSLFLPRI